MLVGRCGQTVSAGAYGKYASVTDVPEEQGNSRSVAVRALMKAAIRKLRSRQKRARPKNSASKRHWVVAAARVTEGIWEARFSRRPTALESARLQVVNSQLNGKPGGTLCGDALHMKRPRLSPRIAF
jgi:hypothetical protein